MTASLASRYRRSPAITQRRIRERYGEAVFRKVVTTWGWWGRPEQHAPAWDWSTWMIRTGRGWGKTRTASEYIKREVESGRHRKIMLLGKDLTDARQIMFENGLMEAYKFTPKDARPRWKRDGSEIIWPNGAKARVFGAEDVEQARGHECSLTWVDELAAFRNAEYIWDEVVVYCTRLVGPTGDQPRKVVTTTPKRKKVLKRIAEDETTHLTRGSTYDNEENLASSFIRDIKKNDHTTVGRQEIFGDQLDEVDGAMWMQELIDRQRLSKLPDNRMIMQAVVGVDPPGSSTGAEAGIIGVVTDDHDDIYVTHDVSLQGSPNTWALTAVRLAVNMGASTIVIEVNQGGDMAETVLRAAIDEHNAIGGNELAMMRIEKVHAHQGKLARSEPVHQLYERGKVWHVGAYEQLEEQMTTFTGGRGEESPDRMDALVWAVTYLAAQPGRNDMRLLVDGLSDLARLSRRFGM